LGEVQAAHDPPSMRQAKVLPASDAVNAIDALVDVPLDGAELIVVSGGVVSAGGEEIVHEAVAGDASVLPAASVARTPTLCVPTARPL
jgi:hypothetical protein